MTETAERIENLLSLVREKMGLSLGWTDDQVREMIDEVLLAQSGVPVEEKLRLKKVLFDELRGFVVIQDLLEDPQITEIMINGPDRIFIEKEGRLFPTQRRFASREKLEEMIRRMAARVNRTINESRPIADVRLADGSRVNMVLSPVAVDGPAVTIRKFAAEAMTLEQMTERGSITAEAAEFLKRAVECHSNILISGGTGSGKTTFLNALSAFIPEDERVITIEDSAELQLVKIPNLVRLEVREANLEGRGEITIRDLVKSALRMRPTRIIIGETRDQAAADLLGAWNTGHDGSLSTIHANSTQDALTRLETLVMTGAEIPLPALRAQMASAIDLIVHLGRIRDGSRRVLEITQVLGMSGGEIRLRKLFTYTRPPEEDEGSEGVLVAEGPLPRPEEKYRGSAGDAAGRR